MKPSAAVFMGIFAAASMLGRSVARADVTDVQVRINPPNAGATDVVRPALVLGDGMTRFRPHVEGTAVGSYQDTVTQVLDFLGIHAEATGSQSTSVSANGDTLHVQSTAQISGSKTLSGVVKTDQASSAGAKEIVVVDFTVSTASVYVFTGSMSRSAAGAGSAGLPDGQVVFLQEGLQPAQVSFTRTGKIAAGRSGHFNIELLGGTGSGTISPPITQFAAAWTFTLDVRPEAEEAPGNDVRWTKSVGGAFGTDVNWDPQRVPVKDLDHRDNAILELNDGYTVDFAVGKTKALGPPQHANRLEVLRGDVTMQSANLLVDELDLVRPSLRVDDGKLTIASGHLTSNSATIGDPHGTNAEIVVDGPDSLWTCQGRLRIGGASGNTGGGKLTITNGADVTSVDTRVGAGGGQKGRAVVRGSGSTWNTDNVHVGFSGLGFVEVLDGGVVTSAEARVGGGFAGGQGFVPGEEESANAVIVTGVAAGGTSSEWDVATLTMGQGSFVLATDGARINATSVGVFASAAMFVGGENQAHHRVALLGCGDLRVGSDAVLDISDGGEADVQGGDLVIGKDDTGGKVDVHGKDSATGTASLLQVDGEVQVGVHPGGAGSLLVRDGASMASGAAFLGTATGEVGVAAVGAGSRWDISDDLGIGGSAQDAPGSVGILVLSCGSVDVDGDLFLGETGALQGIGTMCVGGNCHIDGFFSPSSYAGCTQSESKRPAPRPASTLTIQGNLVVGATGVVRVDAGGPEPDHVVVTGDATLGGTLVLQFMNGYAPKAGEHFDVVRVSGQTTGDFAAVDVRGLAPGAQFETTTSGGTRTMTAVADTSPLPTVSIKPATKRVKEKSRKPLVLRLSRKGDAAQALTVSYVVGGTAANGLDCVTLPGTITIPARKRSAKVKLILVDDFRHEDDETLTMTVLPGAGYTHGLASIAQVTITDDD